MEEKKTERQTFWKGFFWGLTVMLLVIWLGGMLLQFALGGLELPGLFKNEGIAEQTVTSGEVKNKLKKLAEAVDALYYKDVDAAGVADGVCRGLMDSLGDPYSQYFNAEEYADLNAATTGSYYGIGAVLSQNRASMQVSILRVYENSPAKEAGLENGDILLEVDGIAAENEDLSQLVKKIKGEEGSKVKLKIQRDGREMELMVTRRQVEVPTVAYQLLDGEVGYLQIMEFSDVTPQQFDSAVQKLQEQGMTSMIVDIRDNPGGVLDAVCAILDKLLSEELLVYTEDKDGNHKEYRSKAESCMELPLAVLINENSASASEIFAGAIQDYEYGTLIGTTTFGKGIVQQIMPLEDGSAMKVTISQYFTPKGKQVHEVGITPDIELEYEYLNPEDEAYNLLYDNQVQKALEVLQSR